MATLLRWHNLRRSHEFLNVASSVLKMNRFIGLVPRLISTAADGRVTVNESPTSTRCTYVALFIWSGAMLILVSMRTAQRNLPFTIDVFLYTRILTAAAIHGSFILRRWYIHELLKEIDELDVQAPIYWALVPYVLTGASACLSGIHVLLRETVSRSFFPYIHDVIPAIILTSAFCQIALMVSALNYALNHLNYRILQLFEDSNNEIMRGVLTYQAKIRATCSLLHQSYGGPMFLLVFYMFLDMTLAVYFTATVRHWNAGIYFYVMRSLSQSLPSVGLMYVCQQTENTFKETKTLTAKINKLAENFPRDVYDEISEWNVQIRQLPILFTGNGFFRVNNATLRAVISTIITYAVILMQTVKPS